MSMSKRAALVLAAIMVVPSAAAGSTIVFGNGLAADCSREVVHGSYDKATLNVCNQAIETELMKREDQAKTFVNRGVVHLRRKSFDLAERDFASAEKIQPSLPEVFINRGAVRIRQARYQEAITEIEKGIALGPSEPEKAYFNRALAREQLDDVKGAYLDFRKAVELKPEWKDPQVQLERFSVSTSK